ncbi:MAG: response regulator transcription factor [Candidatus Promineifilaceae bacterium]
MDIGKKKRILVVDDSRTVTHSIRKVLNSAETYTVHLAHTPREATAIVREHGLPHLAIVDLNLGRRQLDGFELCRRLRQFSDLPIIMLSNGDTEQTLVEGLQQFAEDYILKPFSALELKVRVWHVLQRAGGYGYSLDPLVHVDQHLQVSFPLKKAFVSGDAVTLTPTETKVLYILMKHAGSTVRTDFLLRRIWPLDNAFEDRIHPHIYRLRRKIEQNPKDPAYIVADWGSGYSFPAARLLN